ncbi:hypothetical protein [Halovivax gelatinilyticus]|uniref:hypothetical protein n=1 Tax=Halovivax gelatinilyticus TaxID=2961597 RepID=UPI0020CA9129|nr:hypothetical protein [Halovivax gelatinilyticus]
MDALEHCVERLDAVFATNPPRSAAERRDWVVRPLLSALGWSAESVDRPSSIESTDVEAFVLSVDVDGSTPAVAVFVDADGLTTDEVGNILSEMALDRAIAFKRGEIATFTGTDGTPAAIVPIEELSDRPTVLEPFSRQEIRSHIASLDPSDLVARRLVVSRDALIETLTDEFADAIDLEPNECAPLVETILDELVTKTDQSAGLPSGSSGTKGDADLMFDQPPNETRRDGSADAPDDRSGDGHGSPATDSVSEIPDSNSPTEDQEGEFVVRVFNDRGKIGAVGHSTSAGALSEATAYLFERGLSGVRLPWPDDGETYVLNDEPVDPDGSRWSAYERLSNGTYLKTSGTIENRAERLEALASRAGLRAMLTGDWSNQS